VFLYRLRADTQELCRTAISTAFRNELQNATLPVGKDIQLR
jgi:hypothetical protein